MTYDGALWGTLAIALTALGGVLSWRALQRRGLRVAMRGAALSLLPIAAWLTGLLRLLTNVLGDIGDWAARLVFSPGVWLGIVVLGVAVVVYAASGLVPGKDKPQGTRRTRAKGKRTGPGNALPGHKDDDFDEVADILRKHGIS